MIIVALQWIGSRDSKIISLIENIFSLQNVKFMAMNKTVVRGITSLNSKFFHLALVECENFKGSKINQDFSPSKQSQHQWHSH
jgi:hypothetical protein